MIWWWKNSILCLRLTSKEIPHKKNWVSWGVLFKGLGVQKETQTPCWLRPCHIALWPLPFEALSMNWIIQIMGVNRSENQPTRKLPPCLISTLLVFINFEFDSYESNRITESVIILWIIESINISSCTLQRFTYCSFTLIIHRFNLFFLFSVKTSEPVWFPLWAPGDADEMAAAGGPGRGHLRDRRGGQRHVSWTNKPGAGWLTTHAGSHG